MQNLQFTKSQNKTNITIDFCNCEFSANVHIQLCHCYYALPIDLSAAVVDKELENTHLTSSCVLAEGQPSREFYAI